MSDREAVRAEWADGDYPSIGERLAPVAPALVEAAGVQAGMEVLDVATGTGNTALAAAERGARVVGVDLTDELLEVARRRAADAGAQADFLVGDAEELEFEEGRFDRVLSSFGVIFAPRPEVAVGELARVCANGGAVAVTSWPVGSVPARMAQAMARIAGREAEFTRAASGRWATEDGLRALFAERDMVADVRRRTDLRWRFADSDEAADFFVGASGAVRALARGSDGAEDAVRAAIAEIFAAAAEPDGAGIAVPFDYLLTTARFR
jgi:SAM-dependent methyltransferase